MNVKSRTAKRRRTSKANESTLISIMLLSIFGIVVASQIKQMHGDPQSTLLHWIILISIEIGLFRSLGLHKTFRHNYRIQYWQFKQKMVLCYFLLLTIAMVGSTFNYGGILFLTFVIGLLYIAVQNVRSGFVTLKSKIPSSISEKRIKLSQVTLEEIDRMTGIEFEVFLSKLFDGMGYYAELTPHNDFGIDLIAIKDKTKTGIQAKCYGEGRTVGVEAVNEVCGGAGKWKVQRKMVITNRFFSKKALISAKSNNVDMVDREGLQQLIREYSDMANERNIFRLFR